MKTRRVFFYFLLLTGLWFRAALASFPAHAPSFSVHESAYGIRLNGGKRENIQSLQIRLVSYAEPGTRFEVQSFFLKKGKPGELPKVDDTVLFEVTNPHAAYEIKAKPIALSGGTKPTKNKSPKNSKSKQATQVTTGSSAGEVPREGFVVRVLCDGILLKQHCSSHQVQEFAKDHPEILNQAAAKKSARYLEAKDILLH